MPPACGYRLKRRATTPSPGWTCEVINEDSLRKMSLEERAALSRSLAAVNAELPSMAAGDQRRRRLVILLTCASVGMIPWIAALAVTLPRHYVAGHWRLTWVGFDIALLGLLAVTAWLEWRRRQAVVITAFVTATLLTCDAWFDITTASGRADVIFAVGSALFLELPLAVLLFAVADHFLRLAVYRAQGVADTPSALLRLPLLGVRRASASASSPLARVVRRIGRMWIRR
jgi:hypothetical protein